MRVAASRRAAGIAALLAPIALGACSAPDERMPAATATSNSATMMQAYNYSCMPCHAEGLGGAPITGDTDEWKSRVSKGMAKVRSNAIDGFEGATGIMPARGGRPDLTDEEINSLVDYMVMISGLETG